MAQQPTKQVRNAVGRFELIKRNGRWEWAYLAPNRRALCAGTQSYGRKESAIKNITGLQNVFPKSEIVVAQTAADVDEDEIEDEIEEPTPTTPDPTPDENGDETTGEDDYDEIDDE